MSELLYFAYGSNLHPVRIAERTASARLQQTGQLCGYRLAFHKQGQDGSGKCNLFRTGRQSDRVLGAIYTLDQADQVVLHRFEGHGAGYIDQQISVTTAQGQQLCYTYIAQPHHIDDRLQPFHWYKQLVSLGARHLGLPSAYIDIIDAVPSVSDQHTGRRLLHEALIRKMNHQSSR